MRKTVVKKTISLQPDVWAYVSEQGRRNVSRFVNDVLRRDQKRRLERAMIEGYKAMAADKAMADDLKLWDTTLLDGLNEDDSSG